MKTLTMKQMKKFIIAALVAVGLPAAASGGLDWKASWAAANKVPSPFDGPLPEFNDTTLRQVVRTSAGGKAVRVWLTNEQGSVPLTVSRVTVALRDDGSAVVPATLNTATFGGASSIVIPPGGKVVSDPVALQVADRTDLVVSMHLPEDVTGSGSPASYHVRALQSNYLAPGDQTDAEQLNGTTIVPSWFYLAAVDVLTWPRLPVIAALGDSITDGDQIASAEPIDLNHRYTDFLAERLLQKRGGGWGNRAAVVNLGISGNQVTATFIGDNMLARLDRDVLTQTGVSHVVVLGGINDIGLPGLLSIIGIPTPQISADQIIAVHQQIAARIRARGLVAIGATITPSGSVPLPGYTGPAVEAKRQAVNTWIRESGAYDAVVDLDQALRDPGDPAVLAPALSADGLHPNSDGYRVIAEEVARVYRGLRGGGHSK